jgi:putative two-component system response regulator
VLPAEAAARRAVVFEAGADDCIQLPASAREIAVRLLNAARVKRTTDSLEDATTTITALANAIEGKDAYTRGHVERVATYAVEIGKRAGVDPDGLTILNTGALVHDVGKVAVPDHILNKPGRLTDEEMEIMKRHPLVGYDILKPLRTFQSVLPIVRWHHERPNGTGYPDGLSGDDFPLFARIMAVADVFDAISSDRPYRKRLPLAKCRDILAHAAENGELDPELVRILSEILHEGEVVLPGGSPSAHDTATPGRAIDRTYVAGRTGDG